SGLSSERSDIILAGCSIINCLFDICGSKKLIVSGCGLREGLFFDYYYKAHDLPVVADNILERSRENILKLYTADTSHSRHITALALNMFDSWPKLHGVAKNNRKLLETAALLHDIGIVINFYSHARHSAYMIQNAQLFGLTHKEQVITAAIAGWHNGVSKNYFRDKFYKELLTDEDWDLVNKLSLLLALAESLDYSQTNQINNIAPYLDKRGAVIKIFADDIPSIEMHQIKSHQSWFRKIFGAELSVELASEKNN
ncbi:MAG: HD domain-containing protein, partial [Phascolarctobacterium sp.]|nr:HD domain-containing protein [Phascolarctobacterium sp.]